MKLLTPDSVTTTKQQSNNATIRQCATAAGKETAGFHRLHPEVLLNPGPGTTARRLSITTKYLNKLRKNFIHGIQ
jgi:hypothetical protein